MFNLSSDFGINSDGETGGRKPYASIVRNQGSKGRALHPPFVFFLIQEHAANPSTTRNPNKPLSQRAATGTSPVRIVTSLGSSALPPTHSRGGSWLRSVPGCFCLTAEA